VTNGKAPSYLQNAVRDSLPQRVACALDELRDCRACPRNCGVNRLANEERFCKTGRYARVASIGAHFGEEDCLRGARGSGTIFFSSCNLRCVFCQNWDISQQRAGTTVTPDRLADMMLDLQSRGCHNINLVTPEHVVPQVVEALAPAIDRGLSIPIVYNTSAYDAMASLRLLDGLVDIFMPDFKFWSKESASRLVKAKDYPERAREAIREMHRQVGDLKMTADGVACRGLLVRHLVMPGLGPESAAIFRWLADDLSPDTFVNIMGQYHPDYQAAPAVLGQPDGEARSARYAEIGRRTSREEMEAAFEAARAAGLWRFDGRPQHVQ